MSFVGTGMEYIEVTRILYDGSTVRTRDVAIHIPLLKADPDIVSIISEETGEVFFLAPC